MTDEGASSPASSPLPVRGCVLAGGAGRRLGRPKATARLRGMPLVSYPLRALRDAGLDPVVVAKPASELPPLDCEVWREHEPAPHPLAGIVEALVRAGGAPLLVCACDMPFVTAELAGWLAAQPEPLVVPSFGGRLHPLLGRYAPGLLDPLAGALRERSPMHQVVGGLDARVVGDEALRRFGEPARLLANVNDAEELAAAERALGAAPRPEA